MKRAPRKRPAVRRKPTPKRHSGTSFDNPCYDWILSTPKIDLRPQCCAGTSTELFADTGDDLWDAPTHWADGSRKFHSRSRYYLHERKFLHATGMHNDTEVAGRLGIKVETLEALLQRAGMTPNFLHKKEAVLAGR